MKSTKTTSSCNNTTVKSFDCEQSEQGNQAKEQNKIQNIKDEINFYKRNIIKKKNDISNLERSLQIAEKRLKETQLAEKAAKIKAILEVNAERTIVFYCSFNEYIVAKAKDVVIYKNENKCLCVKKGGEGDRWEVALEYVERVFVEAEI